MIRTNPTRLFLLLACALAFAGCAPKAPAADSGADVAAVESAAAGWERAYNDKDADAVAAIYAQDAQLLPDGAPAVKGRAAIREHYANEIATAWAKISVISDANGAAGDWAWRSGRWSVETAPPVSGKYLQVWHRTAEGWRLHRDISNSDAPPEAPPPAPEAPPLAPEAPPLAPEAPPLAPEAPPLAPEAPPEAQQPQ
jgi:ketosteroid isomerase-like protein